MRLESHHIESFKELYHQKYGVLLEHQEAIEMATKIARLVEIVELNQQKDLCHNSKYGEAQSN